MDYPIKTLSQLRPILQGFRKTAGLTQAAMASHLGVTQQTYAQLEANPATVSVERLFKVLRVLQVDLQLTQTAGGSASGAAGEDAEPFATATRTAERTTTARSARKASAAPDNVKRKAPSSRRQEASPETPTRTTGPAKQTARATTRETRGRTAPDAPRAAARSANVGKKRETW
ncbi:helix-turn-helix family protein [Paraburkholderia xenovorans LB400]|uniref:Transcriptional regulator, XRE family n=1 Tax=Paraburkholderia xenovorans (strain LB400) TaxID=266265 RepID=Q13FC6_PARXL|nr:helix-turn-helix transcriptional regulator [Paraburkholderia xenovorans]ABE37213.1 transcriptional regulator, XRE family [Paraburkholderia xenovorans LB400]AIP34517.1 helix-turn-helix family protein [Paraburkholderia xenovorans LB400]